MGKRENEKKQERVGERQKKTERIKETDWEKIIGERHRGGGGRKRR